MALLLGPGAPYCVARGGPRRLMNGRSEHVSDMLSPPLFLAGTIPLLFESQSDRFVGRVALDSSSLL